MESPTPPAKKRKIPKWPFIVLGILIIIAGGGYYAYNKYLAENRWKPLLQQQLKAMVLKSTDSLYHIEYSDFDLNISSGDAVLSDFKMVPDSNVYQKLVDLKKAPDNLFTLSVKKLSIKNVGARKAYQEKILNIDNITIEKPNLTIVNKRYAYNDTVKVGKPKTPYEMIKNIFKELKIDSISLKDISVNYINKSNPVTKKNEFKHLDINISNIMIDSLSAADPQRFYYTKGIDIILHNYHIATPDSMYYVDLKKIYFSTAQRKIVLDKVSFLPRYNKTDFYKKISKPTERFSLEFKQIDINNIDLQRFLRDQKLYAGVMNVRNGEVEIYNNNAYKGRKTSKVGKDPHQALQKVALDMKLDTLNIIKSTITYAEADAKSGYTGIITFNKTNASFFNVTNDADVKKINPFMTAQVQTRFMNAAPLQVNFKFNLAAKNGAFNYSGTLGRFDGRVLDKLLKPLVMIHIQSADVEKLHFNVDATNYDGKGKLEFYYKNLNIEVLKKEEGKSGLQSQGFVSKVANTIIEPSNPDKKGNFRGGPINVKRDPTTSFFSFLYKALLDGLKPSAGFSKEKENNINAVVTSVGSVQESIKLFNEQRRINKEKKKEQKKKDAEAKKQQDAKKQNK